VNPQSLAAVRRESCRGGDKHSAAIRSPERDRVRMEYVVIHAEEDAQSVVLPLQSDGVTRLCFRFGFVPIVVFDWRNLQIKRQGSVSSLLQTAGPKQKQHNQYDQTYAAYWIETPLLAMPPNWKSSHKGYDEKYRKNKR
jgi:hypothetical protein